MSKINEVAELVEKGKAKLVGPAVQEAIDEGDDPVAILNDGMISAMSVVGEKFKNGEIFVPEMLVAARAMKKGVDVLKPHLAGGSAGVAGKMIIGTVAGDLHDIGKNLVAMMIESAGFEVIDLGVDVPVEKFIEAVRENPDVKVVGVSALLTTTMPAMKETVEALNKEDFRKMMAVGNEVQSFSNLDADMESRRKWISGCTSLSRLNLRLLMENTLLSCHNCNDFLVKMERCCT